MFKKYGYIGILLIVFAELNFFLKIQPFATFYIPIVWFGYMFFVDSIVYKIKKKSFISNHPKEFLFSIILSLPFWLIFEIYNLFTKSWTYINYPWYVHVLDFTTILPAVLISFSLMNALEIGKRFDKHIKKVTPQDRHNIVIKILVIIGIIAVLIPLLNTPFSYLLMWLCVFIFLDPLNYLLGRPSVINTFSAGKKSIIIRLVLAGLMTGFLWEFWNFQAIPKWTYNVPLPYANIKIFYMPIFGYLGYIPFAFEAFLFYALFRSFIFKGSNDSLSM